MDDPEDEQQDEPRPRLTLWGELPGDRHTTPLRTSWQPHRPF